MQVNDIFKKDKTSHYDYALLADWCNSNNAELEDLRESWRIVKRSGIDPEIARQTKIESLQAFLDSTDYIVVKISESTALGEDIRPLLDKYADIIEQRKSARAEISQLRAEE